MFKKTMTKTELKVSQGALPI